MSSNSKIKIYQGIIEYLIKTTNYTLEDIADLIDSSIENIHLIHTHSLIPANFSSESQLLKLYQTIVELNKYIKPQSNKYTIEIKHVIS